MEAAVPGAAPETCVTGAGARTTSRNAFCRQTPKVGAACGNSACADLCGGRPVTAVPTANLYLISPEDRPWRARVERRSEAERVAAYYRVQERAREKRDNAALRARVGQGA
jgi:hypothetical protein